MKTTFLEHVNITVKNPQTMALELCKLLDWQIRWEGDSMDNGYTVHVGNAKQGESYLALYSLADIHMPSNRNHSILNNLNHIAVVFDDLELVSQRAESLGRVPFNHGNYEPGSRFYLMMDNELELEVASYP